MVLVLRWYAELWRCCWCWCCFAFWNFRRMMGPLRSHYIFRSYGVI